MVLGFGTNVRTKEENGTKMLREDTCGTVSMHGLDAPQGRDQDAPRVPMDVGAGGGGWSTLWNQAPGSQMPVSPSQAAASRSIRIPNLPTRQNRKWGALRLCPLGPLWEPLLFPEAAPGTCTSPGLLWSPRPPGTALSWLPLLWLFATSLGMHHGDPWGARNTPKEGSKTHVKESMPSK